MAYLLFVAGLVLIGWSWWMVRSAYLTHLQTTERHKRELEALIDDLVTVAEEVSADVERRSKELRDLCHQADLLLMRLGSLPAAPAPAAAVTASLEPVAAAPVAAAAAAAEPAIDPSDVAEVRSRAEEVWRLAQQGRDVTDIARLTNKTKGEVQLILGLRKLG